MLALFILLICAVRMVSMIPLILTLGIAMPFVGVLVRYRANYTPKTMMKRVRRIEGQAGLYKGTVPFLIMGVLNMPMHLLFWLVYTAFYHLDGHPPRQGGFVASDYHQPVRLNLKVRVSRLILMFRAITTPHKLDALDTRGELLYLAAGVAAAAALELLLSPRARAPPPPRAAAPPEPHRIRPRAPPRARLQVVSARLTLQRQGPPAPEPANAPPAAAEDVMDFRTEAPLPYTGLADCACPRVVTHGACDGACGGTTATCVAPVLILVWEAHPDVSLRQGNLCI
ncbi:hypothetical protein B0H17DRAFT_1182046 [Mycena rosella]|uniref:Uncharacterized protein n=1 Tax=Mycena rosella TaxID=1033263 RepID=A0AAD7D675_MYCRO|nr:hypothetical protein B0H17DRAFT_1182046 [Mycena rosella]